MRVSPSKTRRLLSDLFRSGSYYLREKLGPRPWFQLGLLGLIIVLIIFLGSTLERNMAQSGIKPGFGFLTQPANFEIGESFISYSSADSFGRAIVVGLTNTLVVSLLGCFLATVLGIFVGFCRLFGTKIIADTARAYVEVVRNTPLLLQLFFWTALLHALPAVKQSLQPLPGVLISNRGVFMPGLTWHEGSLPGGVTILSVALLLALGWFGARKAALASRFGMALSIVLIIFGLFHFRVLSLSLPEVKGFNVVGGLSQSPEFSALLLGLVINSAAGISEIVRSGVEAIPVSQWEAGKALGLRRNQILRLVIFPQSLRIIVPLLTSSYLSLTKNSSLAVAIGYPDLVNIINTTANQTGQSLEAILIMMGVYLSISLAMSYLMNIYNRHLAKRELRHD